jgi:hypothetical protein
MDLLLERRFKPVRYATESVLRYAESATGLRVTLLPPGVTGSLTLTGATPIRARAAVRAKAPAALPEGKAAFSLYVLPERVPAGVPTAVDIVMQLAPEMCPDAFLNRLYLFALEEGMDWYALPEQECDPANRLFRGRHDAPAKAYALVGPAELLPEPSGTPEDAQGEEATPLPSGAPLGLDVLLGDNQQLHGETSRRTFIFERHDQADGEEAAPPGDMETEGPSGGRVFKIENLSDFRNTGDVLPVPEVPGFQFGPGARKSDEERARRAGSRVFRMERLDKVELPEGTGVSSGNQETPGVPEDTPVSGVPPEKAPPASDGEGVAASPDPETKASSADTAGSTEKPALPKIPEVVPVDPNFNFGPAYKGPAETQAEAGGGKRVFKIERDPKPEE